MAAAATKRKTAKGPAPAARTRDDVLADLTALTDQIAVADAALKALFASRAALFHEGRQVDPPVTHVALAAAAGISEPMVVKTLRQPPPA